MSGPLRHLHYLPENPSEPFVWCDNDGLYVEMEAHCQKVPYCPICGLPATAIVAAWYMTKEQIMLATDQSTPYNGTVPANQQARDR